MHARALVDRSMIAHARDECARRVLFFSDIIYSGHYLESLDCFYGECCKKPSLSLETRIVPCRVPSLLGEDCSIGGAICVRV